MQNYQIPVLGFVAASGTGKTTLLACVIPILKAQGLQVGLVKHSHHDFQIDQPGKDSFRLREAGASPVLLVSPYRRAVITEMSPIREPHLDEEVQALADSGLDLILVEGFKAENFPKIELHRSSLGQPLLYPDDPDIVAVATDEALSLPDNVVALDLNLPISIAEFILARIGWSGHG